MSTTYARIKPNLTPRLREVISVLREAGEPLDTLSVYNRAIPWCDSDRLFTLEMVSGALSQAWQKDLIERVPGAYPTQWYIND